MIIHTCMHTHTHKRTVKLHIASCCRDYAKLIAAFLLAFENDKSLNFDKETNPKHPPFEESSSTSLTVFTWCSFFSWYISYKVFPEPFEQWNSKLVLKIVVSVIISWCSSSRSRNHTILKPKKKEIWNSVESW